MSNQTVQPPSLPAPGAAYSHGVVVPAGSRLLYTAGVVPRRRDDGTIPTTLTEQLDSVWSSLRAILAEAGMGITDVVNLTTYVVAGEDLSVVMAARDAAMAGHRPASTLITVPALAVADWRVEIALVAAAS
jgi:2-iminobutanoate/2-iminopropanoate deaminase